MTQQHSLFKRHPALVSLSHTRGRCQQDWLNPQRCQHHSLLRSNVSAGERQIREHKPEMQRFSSSISAIAATTSPCSRLSPRSNGRTKVLTSKERTRALGPCNNNKRNTQKRKQKKKTTKAKNPTTGHLKFHWFPKALLDVSVSAPLGLCRIMQKDSPSNII